MSERGNGLAALSDLELEKALRLLLDRGATTEAQIVAHLAEVEERRLHLRAGFPSMFQYCQQQLGLSESEAFHRIVAARLATAFPVVLELLASRKIHLSAVCLLRRHLTAENHGELLAEACGRSKRQVEALLAARFPDRDFESERRRAGRLHAVGADLYRLEVVLTAAEKERFELARDLISHVNPAGGWSDVLIRAVEALLEKTERRRFAKLRPDPHPEAKRQLESDPELEPEKKPSRTRDRVSRAVRRAVVARDGLACTFIAESGRRCGARAFLQLDHVQAWAHGGPETPDNLRVLCAAHNRLLAEQVFGIAKVGSETKRRAG